MISNNFILYLPMKNRIRRKIVVENNRFVLYSQNHTERLTNPRGGLTNPRWKRLDKTQRELLDLIKEHVEE